MAEDSKSLSRSMLDAFLAEDAAGVAENYAEDAVLYGPNGEQVQGREACRQVFEAMFEQLHVVDFQWDDERETHGDVAFHWGSWNWVAEVRATGARMEIRARTSDVRRLGPDGRWRIVVDHASVPVPGAS